MKGWRASSRFSRASSTTLPPEMPRRRWWTMETLRRERGAGTRAKCHLVFLPSPDGKAIAAAPHFTRIGAPFGALGQTASRHQVDDPIEFLPFPFGSTGGQD